MPYPYTFQAMEADIRTIVRQNNITGWHWAGVTTAIHDMPNTIQDEVFARYPNGRIERLVDLVLRQNSQNAQRELFACELAVYCFQCYESARTATGDQVIGRESDLKRAGLYRKVANIYRNANAGRPGTLFGPNAQGNLLLMNKWATIMNDAWLLGGVHRGANFRLASQRVLENLWNFNGGYLVVTARELIGLKEYGYDLVSQHPHQYYKPRGRTATAVARQAGLRDYDQLIQNEGSSLRDAIKHAANYTAKSAMHTQLLQQVQRI